MAEIKVHEAEVHGNVYLYGKLPSEGAERRTIPAIPADDLRSVDK